MAAQDHTGAVVAFESAHRAQAGFEPAVVGLDPIVRVLLGVVEYGWHEFIHDGEERPGPISHHLRRFALSAERSGEDLSRRRGVPPRRDVDVDDLAVLVDCAVHVTPPASDLHIGLVDLPAVADRVSAGPGRLGEQRRESLHPPVHGDVVDLDAALGEEFLDVAV